MMGMQIRQSRRALDLTQDELAARVGVSRQSVIDWETGRRTPHPTHGERLREVLGAKNTSAPIGVVDPTGAAPRVATNASERGDGEPHRPLQATYAGTPTPDKHRRVTWVTVRTGAVHTHLLETGREPMRSSGQLTSDLRLLVHDPHADPQTNSALAMLAMAAIRECDEAFRVPRVLADGLFEELERQAHRIKTLETTLTTLRAELARVTSRSAN